MNRTIKRICLFCVIFAVCLTMLPFSAFAAGKVDPDQDAQLSIHYYDNSSDKAISGAKFSLYRVADINEYGELTVNAQFAPYVKVAVDTLDQDGWADLAYTLKGCILRDNVPEGAASATDENGDVTFRVKPGLYLVIGGRVTTDDFYTYSVTPFMVILPGDQEGLNEWDYSIDVYPKYLKEYFPPYDDGKPITRKVIKIWDDEGYETIRPEEIVVQLFCDGYLYDTQKLNKENSWRYAWDNLERDHEWLLAEQTPDDYVATVNMTGITFTVTNKYLAPVIGTDPPVQKRITGDTPSTASTFTFVLTAKDADNPMPAGSNGLTKEITITGAGTKEFGNITFEHPGTYVYTVSEKAGNVDGYTYDSELYTLSYEVVIENGEMTCTCTVTDSKGKEASAVEFTNSYKTPGNKIPQTGMLWWPLPVLICLGIVFLMIGFIRRRKCD